MSKATTRQWDSLRLLLLCLLACGAPSLAQAGSHPRGVPVVVDAVDIDTTIGDRIVAFAQERRGRQVGDGECYDLADQALQHVGARSAPAYSEITADGDYIWGKQVDLKDAMAGDIVQFRGYTIKTTVIAREALPDGRIGTSQSWVTEIREHHTAIVERNLGGELLLLEQNVEPGLVVQRTLIPVASRTMQGSPDDTAGVDTTTFEVAGAATVYRPQIVRGNISRHGV